MRRPWVSSLYANHVSIMSQVHPLPPPFLIGFIGSPAMRLALHAMGSPNKVDPILNHPACLPACLCILPIHLPIGTSPIHLIRQQVYHLALGNNGYSDYTLEYSACNNYATKVRTQRVRSLPYIGVEGYIIWMWGL
jgi:hypothetical protein